MLDNLPVLRLTLTTSARPFWPCDLHSHKQDTGAKGDGGYIKFSQPPIWFLLGTISSANTS